MPAFLDCHLARFFCEYRRILRAWFNGSFLSPARSSPTQVDGISILVINDGIIHPTFWRLFELRNPTRERSQ